SKQSGRKDGGELETSGAGGTTNGRGTLGSTPPALLRPAGGIRLARRFGAGCRRARQGRRRRMRRSTLSFTLARWDPVRRSRPRRGESPLRLPSARHRPLHRRRVAGGGGGRGSPSLHRV